MTVKFRTGKAVKPGDLNCQYTLFGGRLLSWIDEECGIYSACQMQTKTLITKYMSEINFKSPAFLGDVIEIGVETVGVGRTSLTVSCTVRDKATEREIVRIDRITFVAVNEDGRPVRHVLAHLAGNPKADDKPAEPAPNWWSKLKNQNWLKKQSAVDYSHNFSTSFCAVVNAFGPSYSGRQETPLSSI